MINSILKTFLLITLPFIAFGQHDENSLYKKLHFGERFLLGASHTYIWQINEFDRRFLYNEFTTNINLTVNLNQRWYVGMQYAHIATSGSTVIFEKKGVEKYQMLGVYMQFDMLPPTYYRSRLYSELSYNLSDYCTCGFDDPYKEEGLKKIGFGIGYDYVLTKRLALESGFYVYRTINRSDIPQQNQSQYIIGLSYNLSKPYSEK